MTSTSSDLLYGLKRNMNDIFIALIHFSFLLSAVHSTCKFIEVLMNASYVHIPIFLIYSGENVADRLNMCHCHWQVFLDEKQILWYVAFLISPLNDVA